VLHLVPGQPDAVAFEQHLGRARQLRKGGDPGGAVAALNSAMALWRGIAFAGVPDRSRRLSGPGSASCVRRPGKNGPTFCSRLAGTRRSYPI